MLKRQPRALRCVPIRSHVQRRAGVELALRAPDARVWQVQLVLVGAGDELVGQSCAGSFAVPPHAPFAFAGAVWIALATLALLLLPHRSAAAAWVWVALLAGQTALAFAR
jgi:hypothetical protein